MGKVERLAGHGRVAPGGEYPKGPIGGRCGTARAQLARKALKAWPAGADSTLMRWQSAPPRVGAGAVAILPNSVARGKIHQHGELRTAKSMKRTVAERLTSVAPPTLALYFSRKLAAVILLTILAFVVYVGYMLLALAQSFLVWPLALLILSVVLALSVVAWIPSWRAWNWEGAVLILDHDGVTDHRRANSFVPWKDIGEVFLSRPQGQAMLCLEFNNDETAKQYVGNPFLFSSLVRYLGLWGHWNLGLGLLQCRPIEVLDTALVLRRHSIRARVREANERYAARMAGHQSAENAPP